MREVSDVGNIQHFETGIADGFGDDQAGIRPDRCAEFVQRARFDEGRGDTETRQRMREQIDGAAIERGRGDDMATSVKQGRNGEMHRGHTARRADSADATFQRGKPLFEHRRGRV